ncbi:[LysW]-aminoadipate kinase [Thermogemmatispora tikiterensis]|uniref:Putative [LysW]-aminoadipate kinase n=1 Tax=Thermogemmatispora tikiterensis TaxID=1825093 RepID=A0A328VKF6_9CHLR|nr:[LysW]-aminoadipate kinase [Thermogemmatispora tikiterensis]RAQ96023.1 acetylglutamate kinase [Thermogemmatispora tikiterensis]
MTLVVKIGGGAGIDATPIVEEIARLVREGERVVVVHGGSQLTNELCERLGHPMQVLTAPNGMTSRYTDVETLRIYAMAVAGQINTELVALLQRRGVNAVGLAGVDGRLLLARRKTALRAVMPDGRVRVVRDDYSGQIEQVNASLLQLLLGAGYTPVVAPLALGLEGERLNVDGDRVAAAIAAALSVETLAILTNVPGLLRDLADPASVVRTIAAHELEQYLPYAQGRMRKKLLGAQEALAGGVRRVCIGAGSLAAVLAGEGTTIAASASLSESAAASSSYIAALSAEVRR